MKKEELQKLVRTGREIEFEYNDKEYSITYCQDNSDNLLSFCEFYQEPIDCKTVEELCEIEVDGLKLIDILESLSDDDFYIS